MSPKILYAKVPSPRRYWEVEESLRRLASPAEEAGLLVQPLPQEAEHYQKVSAAAGSGFEALRYHKP